MKHSLILVIIFITSIQICWAESDFIFGLPKREILYSDPEEALKDNKPVRIEREKTKIESWDLWLLTEEYLFYEGGAYFLSLRKDDGTIVAKYPRINGPFIVSESKKRLLACEISFHYKTENAILFDDSGVIIKKIPHIKYTRDCGKTFDGALFWLHYNVIEKRKPINIIRFLNSNGDIIFETRQLKAGFVSFKYEGNKYEIYFQDPEYPG